MKQPQSLVSAEPSNSQSWNSQAVIGKSKHCSTCEPKSITAPCCTTAMHNAQQRMKCKHGWSRGKCMKMQTCRKTCIRKCLALKSALLLFLNGRKALWATGSTASRCGLLMVFLSHKRYSDSIARFVAKH